MTFPRFLEDVIFSKIKINVFLFIFVMWHGWRSSQRNRSFNTSGDNHTKGLVLMEKICEKNVKIVKTSRKITESTT